MGRHWDSHWLKFEPIRIDHFAQFFSSIFFVDFEYIFFAISLSSSYAFLAFETDELYYNFKWKIFSSNLLVSYRIIYHTIIIRFEACFLNSSSKIFLFYNLSEVNLMMIVNSIACTKLSKCSTINNCQISYPPFTLCGRFELCVVNVVCYLV